MARRIRTAGHRYRVDIHTLVAGLALGLLGCGEATDPGAGQSLPPGSPGPHFAGQGGAATGPQAPAPLAGTGGAGASPALPQAGAEASAGVGGVGGSAGGPEEPPPAAITGGAGRQRDIAPDGTGLYGLHGSAIQARDASSGEERILLSKVADQPVASWFGGWSGDIQTAVRAVTEAAQNAGAVPVLVAYNIPGRDCGQYSAGGVGSADAYRTWIDGFAAGIGELRALIVLEPDAIPLNDCLTAALKQERYELLRYAAERLQAQPATAVYLDGGHSGWLSSGELAQRLNLAGVELARGFVLNTSNFQTTAATMAYGKSVSTATAGAHFLIDTSRNGLGPWTGGGSESWCNPPGRALGEPPGSETGEALVDAFVWVKPPGESDGTCQGGPAAGQFWKDYALGLAQRASW